MSRAKPWLIFFAPRASGPEIKNLCDNEYRACAILGYIARIDPGFSRRPRTSGKRDPLFPNPKPAYRAGIERNSTYEAFGIDHRHSGARGSHGACAILFLDFRSGP